MANLCSIVQVKLEIRRRKKLPAAPVCCCCQKNAAGNPCHTHKHTLIPPTTIHRMHKHRSPSSTAAIKPHVFSSNTLICSLHTEADVHINGQPRLSVRFIKAGMKTVTHKVRSPSVSVLHTLEGIQQNPNVSVQAPFWQTEINKVRFCNYV